MFKKPIIDKPMSEFTDEDYKKLGNWYLMIKIFAVTIFFTAIGLGILCALLTPSSWRWFIKVPIALGTSATLVWFALIVADNVEYNKQKREQAREIQAQRGRK